MDARSAPALLRSLPSWLLNQTALLANQSVGRRLAEAGAHRYHVSMLAALQESGPTSQAELGRRCGLDRSDVTAAVTDLAERGFVERGPDPLDRRRNTVHLTEAGARRLGELQEAVGEAHEELLAPLDTQERNDLARLLTRVLDGRTGRPGA